MVITHKINMDLEGKQRIPWIEAAQWDVYTRQVRLSLFSGDAPWKIPEGIGVVVRYQKPDGKQGAYDTLPDGSAAWSAEENRLTLVLAPQVLTVQGTVVLCASMYQGEKVLNTFALEIRVRPSGGGAKGKVTDSQDYFFVTRMLPAPDRAKIGQLIQVSQVDARGKVTQVEAVDPPEGGADPEQIGQLVEAYLTENPPASGDTVTLQPVAVGAGEDMQTGVSITVTKADGTKQSYTVYDGKAGKDGDALTLISGTFLQEDGVTLKKGVKLVVTGPDGTEQTQYVYDGSNGDTIALQPVAVGAGEDMQTGVSITVTKADGTKQSCTVYDGRDGNGADLLNEQGILKQECLPEGYPYSGYVEIFPQTVFTMDEDGCATASDGLNLTVGETYCVTWNGTAYDCACLSYEEDGLTGFILGDFGLMTDGTSTGEPFVMVILSPEDAVTMGVGMNIIALDGSGTVTLGISGGGCTPISKDWLPEGYGYVIPAGQVVLEETEYTLQSTQLPIQSIVPGTGCRVTWNGTEYSTKAVDMGISGMEVIAIGNARQVSPGCEDTGEPFAIVKVNGAWLVYAADVSTGTVSIVTEKSIIPFDIRYVDLDAIPATPIPNDNLLNGNAEGSLRSATAWEESGTYALGENALAIGESAKAPHADSVAIGCNVETGFEKQVVLGRYNTVGNHFIFAVGDGNQNTRSNAFYIDTSSDAHFSKKMMARTVQANEAVIVRTIRGSKSRDVRYTAGGDGILTFRLGDHWETALDDGVAVINTAMEAAGRNKSAFLWYTDAHWGYGSQMSPMLMAYLCRHTALNKVNFGGDICNDYASYEYTEEQWMELMRDWRASVRNLPGHHSVMGNHDDDGTIPAFSNAKAVYGFLMAPEETADIVRGGDFYYYIDEPSERTRYLYLNTSFCTSLSAVGEVGQGQFAADALASTPDGWHIVAISHIWFLYADTSTPTVGDVPTYCKALLNLFDIYNARGKGTIAVGSENVSYDFTGKTGQVEFCIGGHIHTDHNFTSDRGIPVILTETDSYHLRGSSLDPRNLTLTTDEASVSAIIADYDNHKIHVIRIGRGESREVNITNYTVSYTNVLDSAGYTENLRLSASGGYAETANEGTDLTGYIGVKHGDVIRLKNVTMPDENAYTNKVYFFTSEKVGWNSISMVSSSAAELGVAYDGDNLAQFTVLAKHLGYTSGAEESVTGYIRIGAANIDGTSVITVNEQIA